MGKWGPAIWESDVICDWALEIQPGSGQAAVESALEAVQSQQGAWDPDYLEIATFCCFLVAHALGRLHAPGLPKEFGLLVHDGASLYSLAQAAITVSMSAQIVVVGVEDVDEDKQVTAIALALGVDQLIVPLECHRERPIDPLNPPNQIADDLTPEELARISAEIAEDLAKYERSDEWRLKMQRMPRRFEADGDGGA